MKTEYDSNNSGGHWWLTDEDWKALEAAGWKVDWVANKPDRLFASKDGRFLGALATTAEREGLSLDAAVEEWERITGKSATDAGCPCCGKPHTFTEYDDAGKYVRSGPHTEYVARWD